MSRWRKLFRSSNAESLPTADVTQFEPLARRRLSKMAYDYVRSGGGDERFEAQLVSTDPGDPDRVVADSAHATGTEVDAAVATARAGAKAWASRTAEKRAEALLGAAAWMRERRYP